jgi:poly-D-alanine transfer protein DltD
MQFSPSHECARPTMRKEINSQHQNSMRHCARRTKRRHVNWPTLPKKLTEIGRNKFILFWKAKIEDTSWTCRIQQKLQKSEDKRRHFSACLKPIFSL